MQAMNEHAKPCGWTLVSLRPQGQHAPLRAAAHAAGAAGTVALSPWRLQRLHGADRRAKLEAALRADHTLFTSPAAVVAAADLLAGFSAHDTAHWLAVGEGTLRALQHAGVQGAHAPVRMDSEGLLALPQLQQLHGAEVGLVTAPGGRGLIAPTLQQRGARLLRADVYQRVPLPLPARALARLSHAPQPWILALSSGEALQLAWQQLSPAWRQRWQQQLAVVAASERLQEQALALGLRAVRQAEGPRPHQLVAAAARLAADCRAA